MRRPFPGCRQSLPGSIQVFHSSSLTISSSSLTLLAICQIWPSNSEGKEACCHGCCLLPQASSCSCPLLYSCRRGKLVQHSFGARDTELILEQIQAVIDRILSERKVGHPICSCCLFCSGMHLAMSEMPGSLSLIAYKSAKESTLTAWFKSAAPLLLFISAESSSFL